MVALGQFEADRLARVRLLGGLDPLGDRNDARIARQPHQRVQDVAPAHRRHVQVADEPHVELDEVRRHLGKLEQP